MPQDEPIRVQVPSLGTVEFPAGTSPETMQAAIRKATSWQPADPTEGRSAASRAAGGFFNGAGLNPAPFIELGARMLFHPIDTTVDVAKNVVAPIGRLGNVGDAFRRAGLTGAANEVAASIPILGPASEHASQRMKSGDVAGGVGEVAGMITGATVLPGLIKAGVGRAAPVVTRQAEGLMQTALKPGVARMRDVMRGRTSVPPVVQNMLKNGIGVSDAGLGKATRLLEGKKTDLEAIINSSNATISPDDVVARAQTSRGQLATQATPASDLAAFDDAIDQFVREHQGTGIVKGGTPISVQDAQALKTGTYKQLSDKAYGEVKSGSVEGQKALARGLKEEIETAIPNRDVRGVNRDIANLSEAQEAVGRRVGMAGNRDPGGLAPLAHSPETFFAMLFLRNPAAKSMLARGLYQSAAKATRVPESVLRSAWVGMLQAEDDSRKAEGQ